MVTASIRSFDPVLPNEPDEALLAAVIELSKDLELKPLLRRFVETAAELTGAQYGALGVLNAEGRFDDVVIHGIDAETAALIGDGPHGEGVLGAIIAHPHTLRVPDIAAHEASVGFPEHHPPMSSFLGCPVVIRGQVYGNIYLTNKRDAEEFSARDERVLEALASAAASAIAHARTLAEAGARERWHRAAAEAAQLLSQLPPAQAWPQVVARFDSILTANHVEHVPGHRSAARLGDLAEELLLAPRARFFTHDVAARLVDERMRCAMVVPLASDGENPELLLFAWDRPTLSLDPEPMEAIGQTIADRLSVATLLAYRHAEAERVAILEDRDRIAQDLHDHVIQRIFAAGMRVQSALPRIDDEVAAEKLDAVITDLDETVTDVRRAIFDLHTGGAALALAHTVDQLAAQAQDALGFAPSVSVSGAYWTLDDALVTDHHVGGVFLLGGWVGRENVRGTTTRLQGLAGPGSTGGARLLVAADQEGGQVQQLTGPGFSSVPAATAQARMTPRALEAAATGWGKELSAAGVNVDLAPTVDTVPAGTAARNVPIGALDRHYGSTPAAVSRSGDAVVRGLRAAKVEPTVKHFPGIGRITGNTDATASGTTDTTMTRRDPHLRPFVSGVRNGAGMIMVGSAFYPRIDRQHRAVFSRRIITDVLRRDLGYTGVVVTDDVGVARSVAAVPPAERAARHVAAGGDITLTADPALVGPMLTGITTRAAKDRRFATQVLDSTTRVLTLKQRMGLITCGSVDATSSTNS